MQRSLKELGAEATPSGPIVRRGLPATPVLCLVTDVRYDNLGARVAQAVAGGATMVQLRAKTLPGGELLALACELERRLAGRAVLVLNERIDVALAAGVDGVHLGEEALPTAEARRLVGHGVLVGRSVHGVEAAIAAEREGANYLVCGTVFATRSHSEKRVQGLSVLREVVHAVRIPVLGIGGIGPGNAGEVIDAGASGVAVISAILGARDPARAAGDISHAMHAVAQAAACG